MQSSNKLVLLTRGESSPKLAKDQRYLTYILYLASAHYRTELCPAAGDCKNYCLITKAGRGAIGGPDNSVQRARKARTDLYYNNRPLFMAKLVAEIRGALKYAKRRGLPLAIRLNGGSDLDWSEVYTMFASEPIQWWEYTKRPDLALKLNRLNNVHVTYSHNELTTDRILGTLINNEVNIAMVFDVRKGKPLPANVGTMLVIDGDESDLRFLDSKGVVVGLRLKSLRKVNASNSPFVRSVRNAA